MMRSVNFTIKLPPMKITNKTRNEKITPLTLTEIPKLSREPEIAFACAAFPIPNDAIVQAAAYTIARGLELRPFSM